MGRATARRFAAEGAAVALAARSAEALTALAQEITREGGRAIVAATDVQDATAVERLSARTLEAFGRIDILVYATGTNQGADFFKTYNDPDTSAAVVTFANGTLGVVSNTRYNGRGYDVRLEVHGSKDSVAAGVDESWPIRALQPGVEFPSGQPHRFFMDRFLPAFRAEFETFLDVVAGNRPSPCTVADGLEADWIAEACAKSQQEHRPVRIEEVRIP